MIDRGVQRTDSGKPWCNPNGTVSWSFPSMPSRGTPFRLPFPLRVTRDTQSLGSRARARARTESHPLSNASTRLRKKVEMRAYVGSDRRSNSRKWTRSVYVPIDRLDVARTPESGVSDHLIIGARLLRARLREHFKKINFKPINFRCLGPQLYFLSDRETFLRIGGC